MPTLKIAVEYKSAFKGPTSKGFFQGFHILSETAFHKSQSYSKKLISKKEGLGPHTCEWDMSQDGPGLQFISCRSYSRTYS